MSRSRSCARKHRARRAEIRLEFQSELRNLLAQVGKWDSPEDRIDTFDRIEKLLRRIADSDVPLWQFEEEIVAGFPTDKYAIEERAVLRAMIAQIVHRHLANCTQEAVYRLRQTVQQPR